MIHPDILRVDHKAEVKAAIREYREVWREAAVTRSDHADAWKDVKAAEMRLNEVIQRAVSPGR